MSQSVAACARASSSAAGRRNDFVGGLLAALLVLVLALLPSGANAMKIQKVKSPGGLEAWLVEEHAVPLMALRFSFDGGNAQDPAGKDGLANFLTGMMDEGAGDLTAIQFQERMEEIAMRMGFEDGRDALYGSLETLTQYREKAVALLKLALTQPRFDRDAADRVRQQLLARLAFEARDPDRVAGRIWSEVAFPGHPYGRPANGKPETLAAITRDDLEGYRKRVFAKSTLKIVAVGDIDAKTLGTLIDDVFGGLPDKADLVPVSATQPVKGGVFKVVEMDVPQSVVVFGHGGIARKDPDFMPAFVVNHILGGGSFASRLMEEVREKRGLAYGVYSYLQPYSSAAVFAGSVATKNEAVDQSLDVIKSELKRMADLGPSPTELDNAKKFLTGSYALRFDTNAKIADQLLAIQRDNLGIDYVDKRNAQVEAVTVEDAKRVAKRLLTSEDLIVTIVGKPTKVTDQKK
jgi:zinc protease